MIQVHYSRSINPGQTQAKAGQSQAKARPKPDMLNLCYS